MLGEVHGFVQCAPELTALRLVRSTHLCFVDSYVQLLHYAYEKYCTSPTNTMRYSKESVIQQTHSCGSIRAKRLANFWYLDKVYKFKNVEPSRARDKP